MTIYEFADICDISIVLNRYPNQKHRWTAKFDGAEIKDGHLLISAYGDGFTPEEAILDYCSKIVNKTLVFSAMSKDRRQYRIPASIGV